MNHKQDDYVFYEKTLTYKCALTKRLKQYHLVPHVDAPLGKQMFDDHDRKILRVIRSGAAFVICAKDFARFQSPMGHGDAIEGLMWWHLRIITQSLLYGRAKDAPTLKILAFGDEVERLCHIVALLETSGMVKSKIEQMQMLPHRYNYQAQAKSIGGGYNSVGRMSRENPRKIIKLIVMVEATPQFYDEFLEEARYNRAKELLEQMKIPFQEELHRQPKLINQYVAPKNELKVGPFTLAQPEQLQKVPKIAERPPLLKAGDFEEEYEVIHADGKTEIVNPEAAKEMVDESGQQGSLVDQAQNEPEKKNDEEDQEDVSMLDNTLDCIDFD